MEDDRALLLCRERKHLVRIALDGRCLLADAHLSYIQSLRNAGIALRKFVEPGVPAEPSLYHPSASMTPIPLALTPQISNSPLSHARHVEAVDSISPAPSPPPPTRVHVSHMKAGISFAKTIKEKIPAPVKVTVRKVPKSPKNDAHQMDESLSHEDLPSPNTPPWDYFGLFHPIDNCFADQDAEVLNNLDNVDEVNRLRKEEGIPELEEEEISSLNGKGNSVESEDDFDQPSGEELVRIFRNRNEEIDPLSFKEEGTLKSPENAPLEAEQKNRERNIPSTSYESDDNPETPTLRTMALTVVLTTNGKDQEHVSVNKPVTRDFISCMKEIQNLFVKASDSGVEVPRMLEANNIQFRALFTKEKANKSKVTTFLSTCFGWCAEEVHLSEEPASKEIKYLTWDRSVSSLSSSSRIPLNLGSRDDMEDIGGARMFSHTCMDSGSHDLTLDRLYAWERKLHDEVKASGVIRKDYDMKCRLLQQQEAAAERQYKIDKTRAAIKDLHSRVRVAILRIDTVSKKIEELRDKELQPQLEELIRGLSRMWATMLDCHKQQCAIISAARGGGKLVVGPESHRQHAVTLLSELDSLSSTFSKWVSAQEAYLKSIYSWLVNCVSHSPAHKSSRRRKAPEFSPRRDGAPPIFVICRDWMVALNRLPTKNVADSIKELVAVANQFLSQQLEKQGHGGVAKLGLSFSRKPGRGGGEEDGSKSEAPAITLVSLDGLQSGLLSFMETMKNLAAAAVEKYSELQDSIRRAKEDYERKRPPPPPML